MEKKKTRNPKIIGGLALLAVLAALGIALAVHTVPLARETARVMSLTPTPVPPYPANMMAVTPAPSLPTPAPVLRSGSSGQQVTDLQSRLQTLGYYSGAIDGQYGAGTRDAVKTFQRQNGLEEDGAAGEQTQALLFSPQAKPWKPETDEAPGSEAATSQP